MKNIKNFIEDSNKSIEKVINESLSKKFLSFNEENFPLEKGIYFIYEKETKKLLYIGSTTRTFKRRCSQYLHNAKRGASFRNKIIKHVFNSTVTIKVDGKEVKNKDVIDRAIKYIKDNLCLKFLVMDENSSDTEILLIERACITLKTPDYND